ncbi:hypothetical protein M513_11475 [Trichuris suis]|uniref:Secreted protein n=1 Tax=Trichuris suis TaxID=68888 RepID=A0A085LRT8_9BILA|nr:hypothetical protein M513_11475 [Trichuris suis]
MMLHMVLFLFSSVRGWDLSACRERPSAFPGKHVDLAVCVTVGRLTIAKLDVPVSPRLKRRVIPLRFVLNTCARQADGIAKSNRLFEAWDHIRDCCW